jgi:hypothetical protein
MKILKTVKAGASLPFDAPAVQVPMNTGIVNKKVQNKAVFLSGLFNVHLPQYANNIFYYNLGISPYFMQQKELADVLATLSESYPGLPKASRQRGLIITPMILRSTAITASFNSDKNPALVEACNALCAAQFIVGKL